MRAPNRQQLRLSGGTELSFITAGESSKPAVLLLHGTPQSARYFRDIVPELSRVAYVIAPDLPGFGESDVLPTASFAAYGQAISELLTGSRSDRATSTCMISALRWVSTSPCRRPNECRA
jgi:pimeloyl-ACP methyl ester carboxylesterase